MDAPKFGIRDSGFGIRLFVFRFPFSDSRFPFDCAQGRPVPAFYISFWIDGHHDALAAEPLGCAADEIGVLDGGGVDRDLVGPRLQQTPDVVDRPDAPADRERHETLLGRAADDIDEDVALLVAGGDVEEDQLVGPLAVVPGGHLNRVAGIAQVQELRPLDHAAAFDVQARDDAFCQQARSLRCNRPALAGPFCVRKFAKPRIIRAFVGGLQGKQFECGVRNLPAGRQVRNAE